MKMRTTVIVLLVAIGQTFALGTYSQNTRLNINMSDATIGSVLEAIENQSEFYFMYESNKVNVDKKISVNATNKSVDEVLHELFSGSGIIYKINNRQIALTTESENIEGQQVLKVAGKVSDSSGAPVPGASIVVKGTTKGVITDPDGKFSISIPADAKVLVISFVGMKTQDISVGNKSIINVVLEDETIGLEEVVAIGYGTIKKSDLTGSVSSIKAQQLVSFPASGAVQALQGRASGVQITSNNGDPGGSVTVKIRGGTSINASSEPLYVVDGFPGAFLPQAEDIESLEVLKDPSSTAIYGSRGANGVIMITTKKGKKGKTRIEYNTSISQQSETHRFDLLNSQEFLALQQPFYPTYVSDGQNSDWQDVIFQKGSIQTHQISLSGGNETMNFYISGSYFDQKGLIINSGFNKYSITSNIDIQATSKLKVGVKLFAQRANTDGVPTQEGSGGSTQAGVIGSALRFMPDQGIYKPDGVTYSLAKLGDPIDNPYTILQENTRESVSDRMMGNFSGEYKLFENLTINSTLGVSTRSDRTGNYATSLTNSAAGKGNAAMNAIKNSSISSENYINYNQTFASVHKLNFMAGYTYSYERNESWGANTNSFITDAFSFWNMGGGTETPSVATSGVVDEKLISFYGRLNYGYNDKYLVTFTSRYDGSSKFSKNQKWAFFPSGSAAWNMHKESFLKNLSTISQWKWRVSYGIVGSQAINSYQTLARLSPVLSIVNGVQVNAVRPVAVANDNLKWESTASTNLGTDIGLFKNRLNLTLDFYKNITSDQLFPVNLPPYAGIATQLQNVGKLENKGLEVTLTTKNFTGDFQWNTDFNISFNRNKVLELPDGKDILYNNAPGHWPSFANARIMRVGEALGSFWGYTYDGVYQTGDTFIPGAGFEQVAGGEKYRDINGKDASGILTGNPDNALNTSDLSVIGNPNPDFIFGFNNEFKYKDFDLVVFINGSQGNDIYSYQFQELDNLGAYGYNATKAVLNRWSPTNTNTDVPMKMTNRSLKPSSRWIMDGSYIRIRNIMLGYTLPQNVTRKLSIQKLRLYISAQNYFTFTKYKGYDPEVNYRASNTTLGTDYASYPMAKSLTAGLNITF